MYCLQERSVFLEVLDEPSHVRAWSNLRFVTDLSWFAEWVKETRGSPFDFFSIDVSDFGVEAVPVDIVWVECKSALCLLIHFVCKSFAGISLGILSVAIHLVVLKLLVQGLTDEVVSGNEIESVHRESLGIVRALCFIRAPVSDGQTCQVDPRHVLVGRVRVVVDDLARQSRDVNPRIALSRNVELIIRVLLELQKERHQSL